MLFKSIKKTEHYRKYHQDDVPWSEVIAVIEKQGNKQDIL